MTINGGEGGLTLFYRVDSQICTIYIVLILGNSQDTFVLLMARVGN
jgi:hypothetical protein